MGNRDLPAWIADIFDRWQQEGQTGWLLINFHRGCPVEVEARAKHFRPKPVLSPTCPRCGGSMASRDNGTLYVCPCGQKRTQSQVERVLSTENG